MFKLDDTVKAYFLGIISVILVVLIFFFIMTVVNNLRSERILKDKKEFDNLYGMVIKKSGDYIVIKPIDEEIGDEVRIRSDVEVEKGDFVLVSDDIEIIASEDEMVSLEDETTKVTTTTITVKSITSVRTTTKTSTTTTSTYRSTTKIVNKDALVLGYVEDVNHEIESNLTFKDKAKNTFISVVDFIFYDGEILGVTWNELSNQAKAKVLYYTLIIDNKIDSKWPNYKEEIGNKVEDIKSKLIAKYMEITTNLCTNNPNACEQAKSDFSLLKTSLGLTWDVVKSAFKYGYDKTTTYLRTWYEVFSGKV